MPFRPEAELKRPDLKGEFTCGVCFKRFCHAASLNRHRLNFHSGNHHCNLCNQEIPNGETLKSHMGFHHGIERVFTCGCCNWAFPDKKELHQHTSSMLKTGEPGTAHPIATNLNVAPGSMVAEKSPGLFNRSAHASLAGSSMSPTYSPATPVSRQRATATATVTATPMQTFPDTPVVPTMPLDLQQHLIQALAMQLQSASPNVPAWLRCLMLNNPALPTQIFKNMVTNNNAADEAATAIEHPHSEDESSACSSSVKTEPEAPAHPFTSVTNVKSEPGLDCPISLGTPLAEPSPSPSVQLLRTDFKQEAYDHHSNTEHDSPAGTLSPSLSIDMSASTPASSSDGATTPPCEMYGLGLPTMVLSPRVAKKSRKRTINDVVSFLHKKQVV